MDIRNGLLSVYNGVSASVGTSNAFDIFRSTSGYVRIFNNSRFWAGNGTPVDAGFQVDINGTTRLNGNVTLGASIITNTIITGSSPNGGSIPLDISNGINPIFQVVNNATNGPVSTLRLSQGGIGGPVLIGTNGQQGWGTGGTGSVQLVSGIGSLAGWAVSATNAVNIGWNNGAVSTAISNTIRLGDVNSLQSVGASSVAIGNGNWGLLVKGDGTTNQIRLGAVDLISNVTNSTTIGIGLSTSLSNVVLLGTSTQTVMIGAGTSAATGSTIFQIDSTTKGFLPPRTGTTGSIVNPVQGLITYVVSGSNEGLYYYSSGSASWLRLATGTSTGTGTGLIVASGSTGAALTQIYSVPTGSARAAFYNYAALSQSNARAGQISAVWFGTTMSYNEVSTTDVGNTNDVVFSVAISGSFVNLNVTASAGWSIRTTTILV